MAKRAKYRPAAPSDGCGHIQLTNEEFHNPERLQREARQYAAQFLAEDDAMEYPMGCPDGAGNRAFCFIIEAAREICGAAPHVAEKLLRMALAELKTEYPPNHLARKGW